MHYMLHSPVNSWAYLVNFGPNSDWARVIGACVSASSDNSAVREKPQAVQRNAPTQILLMDGTISSRGTGSNACVHQAGHHDMRVKWCSTEHFHIPTDACIGDASVYWFLQPKSSVTWPGHLLEPTRCCKANVETLCSARG
ncbi:hypothetical protein PMIN03_011614 [Paraphaeosphaeria minitans]